MRNTLVAGLLVAGIALLAGPAERAAADILADDPNAMPAWQGTNSSDVTSGGMRIKVDVDFAVFAPGEYPGDDPSGGTDYVYAYQFFNDAVSDVAVCVFSVGIGTNAGADNIGDDPAGPGADSGVPPDLCTISQASASARWAFGWTDTGVEVMPGQNSTVLIYTSPNGPRWCVASVIDGGLPVPVGELPAPVPEPASAMLLLLGALGALGRLRRR